MNQVIQKEKRIGNNPIPKNINKFLNVAQIFELKSLENYGWNIKFIRRPLFQDSTVVVASSDGSTLGVLEPDGQLNLNPDIPIR